MYSHRFDHTIEHYIKYRPGYPESLFEFLTEQCQLTKYSMLADIGSGTGLLTELFLKHGMQVVGVEPNEKMRAAGDNYLSQFKRFKSISGTAEAIPLKSDSIDLVMAGTAFHWFDADKAKIEFTRILKPYGWVALIWNVRDYTHSPLMQAYEKLITKYNTDFDSTPAKTFNKNVTKSFFAPFPMIVKSIPNKQYLDLEGFKGRLLSTSYSLPPAHPQYAEMLNALEDIFQTHQLNNLVEMVYETKVYVGQLK